MNFIFTYMLPYLPKWFSKPFAKPYVAGETTEIALNHIKKLNHNGFSATLDILGEYTSKVDTARDITDQYCQLYDEINKHDKTSPPHTRRTLEKVQVEARPGTAPSRSANFSEMRPPFLILNEKHQKTAGSRRSRAS